MRTHRLTLFVYRTRGARCHPSTLYDHLHGFTEVRIKKDAYGRTARKIYRYPGIPHRDVLQSVLVVSGKNARALEELFNRYGVPYIKCPAPVFVRWEFPAGVRFFKNLRR
jgi:hypothetical protein